MGKKARSIGWAARRSILPLGPSEVSLKFKTWSRLPARCLLAALPLLVLVMPACSGGGTNSATASAPSSNAASVKTQISGAVLGYVWDATAQGLRAIQGLPGAAYLAAPSYNSGAYTSAVASSSGGYALLTSQTGDILLALLPSGQPALLTAAFSSYQHVALSPSGSAAIVFADDKRSALVFTNLPGAPQLQQVQIPPQGSITNICVSDSGLLLVALDNGAAGVAVYSVSANGTAQQVANLARYGGMRFVASSNDVLIADAAQNIVWSAKNVATGAALLPVASAADGVAAPVAVAGSVDGRWAVIAGQTGVLLSVDLTGATAVASAKCQCSPSLLAPLAGNATFQVTPLAAGPVWLYVADAATPQAMFVPAPGSGN